MAANGAAQTVTVLVETNSDATTKIKRELGSFFDVAFKHASSIETFLDYDAALRLRRMPHKGSSWDKILQRAGYFASQSYLYAEAIESFANSSQESAAIIRCSIILLLELDPHAAPMLEPIFRQFYDLSLTLESLHHNQKLFDSSIEIRQSLTYLYADVVKLAAGITSHYGHRGEAGSYTFVSEEFSSMYSSTFTSIFERRENVSRSMWSYSLRQVKGIDSSVEMSTVRSFLSPFDLVVRSLLQKRAQARYSRDEMSCEWFQGNLTRYLRGSEHLFLVSGQPGSGKSILSAWIAERIKRGHGAQAYDVLVQYIEPDVPAQTTTISVIKGLLLQLLDRNIGNTDLYTRVVGAMQKSNQAQTSKEIEDSLWPVLEAGLQNSSKLIIIVDGLNHMQNSQDTASNLVENLNRISSKYEPIKTIIFTQEYKAPGQGVRHYEISAGDNRQNIVSFAESVLESPSTSSQNRHQIAQEIAVAANGSFTWASYALALIQRGESLESIPKSLPELMKKVVSFVNMKSADARSLVAWLLAAQRPLKISEIKTFLEIDLNKCALKPVHNAVEEEIFTAIGPIIDVLAGFVQIKDSVVRAYLLERAGSVKDMSNTGDFPFMMKEAHYDLAARCHAYLKLFVTRSPEVSTEVVKMSTLDTAFDVSSILEYTMSFWMQHFLESPMYNPSGQHKLVPQFRDCFSGSVFLASAEWTIWARQTNLSSALQYLELTCSIRRTILKESKATLQSILILAKTYESLSELDKAASHYYLAYTMSITLYGESSEFANQCATTYLKTSKTTTITERNEVAMQQEQILKHIIKTQKTSKVTTYSTLALYTTMLAQLYTNTKQYDEASTAWKDVHTIAVSQYGKQSKEAASLHQSYMSSLEKSSKKEELSRVKREQLTSSQTEVSKTTQQGEASISVIVIEYESKHEYARAEEVLVNHWRTTCHAASSSNDSQLHVAKLDATLLYVQFLKKHDRKIEAGNVLRGVWSEYESRDFHSDQVVSRLKLIGSELKSLRLIAVTLAIFSSIFGWFQKSGKTKEAAEVQTQLNETTRELVETRKTETNQTATGSASQDESAIHDVWKSLGLATSGVAVDKSTAWSSKVKIAETLSSSYYKQEQWNECLTICLEVLSSVWASFSNRSSGKIVLPELYRNKAIRLATRVGDSYFATRQFEKAEDVYLYIFHATLVSLEADDTTVTTCSRTLSTFYERTFQTDKRIKVLHELYNSYKAQLGAADHRTIAIAYEAGDLCLNQSRPNDAEPFFLSIYSSLGESTDTFVHKDAMKAAESLSVIYEQQQRWDAAEGVYRILWQTWVKRGKEYKFTTIFVEKLYTTYLYILQEIKKVSYKEVYQLTKTYRETCKSTFGTSNELTIKATLRLAEVTDQKEEHRSEAIEMYEELIEEHSKTSSITAAAGVAGASGLVLAIYKARQRLTYLYTTQTTTSSKAVSVSSESYEAAAKQYGYVHVTSLQRLKEHITICSKQQNTASKEEALAKLNNALTYTVVNEKDSEELFNAGHTFADSYILLERKDIALEILREMRRQVITEDYNSRSKTALTMKGSNRGVYVFIIAFSQTLLAKSGASAFSELMADLMTETLLYQSYTKAVEKASSFEDIRYHGTRLARFYSSKNRGEDYDRTILELLEHFAAYLSISKSSKSLRDFFGIYFQNIETKTAEQIVETSVALVLTKMKASAFQEAYDIATYTDKLLHIHGTWSSTSYVDHGITLCLHLTGRSGTPAPSDTSLISSIRALVEKIMTEVMKVAKDMNLQFITLPVSRVDGIVCLLSDIKDYAPLEQILTQLWESRQGQTSWSSEQIVWVGRRLVEVRFLLKKQDEAVHLCQDITYNLRRTWGPADKLTVELSNLLAALYTATGDHKSALAVHEDVLRSTLASVDEDGDTTPELGAAVVSGELELLYRAYLRNGGFEKNDSVYKDLYDQMNASMGKEKEWTAAGNSPEKWSTKEEADSKGTWTPPTTFTFMNLKGTDKHTNNLKRTSGLLSSPRWKKDGLVNGN